jgi:hypothetical protein
MRHKFKMLSVAAAVLTLGWAGSVFAQEVTGMPLPRSSHAHRRVPHTVLQPYLTPPAQAQKRFFWYNPSYQAPDGTYYSLAAFSRDVRGVPCGMECTPEARAHWSRHYYYDRPYNGPYSQW